MERDTELMVLPISDVLQPFSQSFEPQFEPGDPSKLEDSTDEFIRRNMLQSNSPMLKELLSSPMKKSNQIKPALPKFAKQKSFKQFEESYDPYLHLNHFDKVKVENELASQSITPFNSVEYIQVLFNPTSDGPNREIITVQLFKPSIRLLNQELKKKAEDYDKKIADENYRQFCLKNHALFLGEILTDQVCALCEIKMPKAEEGQEAKRGYSCRNADDCDFFVCQPCNLKHYIRHNLIHQTSQHHFYIPYELQCEKDDILNSPENHNLDAVEQEAMRQQRRLKDLESNHEVITKAAMKSTVTASKLANVVPFQSVTKRESKFAKYVVLGFWRYVDGVYDCYRMFKVNFPCFHNINRNNIKDKVFLHISNDNQLVFFNKSRIVDQKREVNCNFLDLDKAMTAKPESELKLLTNFLYKVPIVTQFVFPKNTVVSDILDKLLINSESYQSRTLLQILNVGQQILLVAIAPYAYATDTKTWEKTEYGDNLLFFDLQLKRLEFTVYHADLLFEVEIKDGMLATVMFLRDLQVVQVEWGATTNSVDTLQNFLQQGLKPQQSELESYNFVPLPNSACFALHLEQLHKSLNQCKQEQSLITAFLHKNRTRVTLHYQRGGIFTFELKKRQEYHEPSTWQGQIAEIKDFEMTDFIIAKNSDVLTAQGKDSRGYFTVVGKREKKTMIWDGFYIKDERRYEMHFDRFLIKDDVVDGSGEDTAGSFIMQGKVDQKQISFEKRYDETNVIYFRGTVNQDKSKIIGYWGSEEGQSQGLFELKQNLTAGFTMDITYKNTQNNKVIEDTINLVGTLDYKTATASGTVTCSKNLQDQVLTTKDKKKQHLNKFFLVGHQCQNRAVQIFFSSDFGDASLSRIKTSDSMQEDLHAIGNMRKVTNKKQNGYQMIDLDLINLDFDELVYKKGKKVTLSFQMPSTFEEVLNKRGHLKLPYYVLMQPTIQVESTGFHSFQTQIFYHDSVSNQKRLCFINGQERVKMSEMEISTRLPQRPPIMSENYTINYPLLAYKSNLPNDQQIVICNLAKNQPQKFISIAPYKFVQFLDLGLHPQHNLISTDDSEDPNTMIFILVSLNNCFYVMGYRQYPWNVEKRLIDPLVAPQYMFKGHMLLLTGQVNYQAHKFTNGQVSADKIQSATLLKRSQSDGAKVIVVLQLVNEIVCFSLYKKDFFFRMQSQGFKMSPQLMERGPGEQVFYCEKNNTSEQQLCQLTYVDKLQPTSNVIYRTNDQILQFSIAYQKNLADPNCVLVYILSSKQKLIRLNNKSGEFINDLEIDVSENMGIQGLTALLTSSRWSKIILRERNIISLVQSPDSSEAMVLSAMSLNSELSILLEPLNFDHDRKHTMLQQGRQFTKGLYSVRSLQQVPWMGKNIFEVKESKNNFFLIKNQLSSRRIDLMRIDTELSQREDQLLLGNSHIAIKMRNTNQFMLYSQKSFEVQSTYPAKSIKQLTAVLNGVQYFAVSDCYSSQDHYDTLIRVNQDGTITTMFSKVDQYLKAIRNQYKFQELEVNLNINRWAFVHQAHDKDVFGVFGFYQRQQVEAVIKNSKLEMGVYLISEQNQAQVDLMKSSNSLGGLNYSQIAVQRMQTFGQTMPGSMILNSQLINSEDQETQNQKVPTVFIIACPLKVEENATSQVILTKDFLVIKFGLNLLYTKLNDVITIHNEDSKSLKFAKPELQSDAEIFKLLLQHNKCQVQFHAIDIQQSVSSHILKNDFHIGVVADYDLKIAKKDELIQNAIQITCTDIAIIWDLDSGKEVQFLTKPDHFSKEKDYQPTGFVPHTYSDSGKNMQKAKYITQNEDRSLIVSAQTDSQNSHIFRTFTNTDLYDVEDLRRRQAQNLSFSRLDMETMLANFNGLTFFQIFRKEEVYFTYLENLIKTQNYVKQVVQDESGQIADNIMIRRLYQTFQMPVIREGYAENIFEGLAYPQLIQAAIYEDESQHLLLNYLRLLMLSTEYRLSDLFDNFDGFKKVFEIQSNLIQVFLEESHFENDASKEVRYLKWDPNQPVITFGAITSLLSAETIQKNVENQQKDRQRYTFLWLKSKLFCNQELLKKDLKVQAVRVRILEIEWISDKMNKFYTYLNSVTDNQTFGNKFIQTLLEQQNYSAQVFFKVFLPYMSYITCTLIYFSRYVPNVPSEGFFGHGDSNTNFQVFLRTYMCFCAVLSTCVEIYQITLTGLLSYANDPWNYIFWSSNILGTYTLIAHGVKSEYYPLNTLIQMGSVQIVLQWILLYYWMRLFPTLAFYVNLISETIKDIGYFMIMFIMCITMFANTQFALNGIKSQDETAGSMADFPNLWPPAFGPSFFDSMFNQYLIGLGQFDTDPYFSSPASTLIYIYFILATLFTQIMFLNMLIAIMGETFGRCVEAQERNALMERTHLYADFIWGIQLKSNLRGKRYLYVVRPVDETAVDESATAIENVQERLTELIRTLKAKDKDEIASLNQKIFAMLQAQQKNKADVSKQFEQVNQTLETILSKLK